MTSLPSPYGIGDLAPGLTGSPTSSRNTPDLLANTAAQSDFAGLRNSPYSSISTFACNTLLVSPDMLVEDGLLDKKEVEGEARFS